MVLNYFGLFYLSEQGKAFRGCYFSPTQKCSSRPIFAISFPFLDLINFIKERKVLFLKHFSPTQNPLLYFFQCMTVRGIYLEPYMKQIKSILRKALRIQNKEGHSTAVILLKNMLRSLTSVYPKEYWSCPEGYDRPLSEHLPIRQWGKPGNIHSLKVSIQCPIID